MSNSIRTNPQGFVKYLEARRKEIEADDNVVIMSSMIPSALNPTDRTYDNLIKTERAISALNRATPQAPLVWNDGLFLAAYNHCNEQKNLETPSLFTNFVNSEGVVFGKRRPQSAVAEFATATDVDLNISTGVSTIDQAIDNFLNPENRVILMSPQYKFSSVHTCVNDFSTGVAI